MSQRPEIRRGRGRGQLVRGYPRPARLPSAAAGSRPEGGLPEPIPEAALYPVVARWLTSQGYVCWRDVSYLGRWIDLFAEHPDGQTVAVELKVADWKRALLQARLVQPSVTRVYIGLWAPFVHRAQAAHAEDALVRSGVGLLAINGGCEVLAEPTIGTALYGRWVQKPSRASHRPIS